MWMKTRRARRGRRRPAETAEVTRGGARPIRESICSGSSVKAELPGNDMATLTSVRIVADWGFPGGIITGHGVYRM